MENNVATLFPNFTREYLRVKNNKIRLSSTLVDGVPVLNDIPKIYADYQLHVNSINSYKSSFSATAIKQALAKAIGDQSETTRTCSKCLDNVSDNLIEWEGYYNELKRNYKMVSQRANWIHEDLFGSIEALMILTCSAKSEEEKIAAKRKLDGNIQNIMGYLDDAEKGINDTVKHIDEYRNNFDSKHKEELKTVIDNVVKEVGIHDDKSKKLEQELKQLKDDIETYNARITALGLAMGISVSMVLVSVCIDGALAFVVALFVLPAIAVAIAELVNITAKLKSTQQRIEEAEREQKQETDIVNKLKNVRTTVDKAISNSDEIKQDMLDVNAPWNALKEDMNNIKKIIEQGEEKIDYDKMLNTFIEVHAMWHDIQGNLFYLDLDKHINNVVKLDDTDFSADTIEEKAKEKGMTMADYMAA